MDGLDIQCRPTERNPGRIALDRHFGSSHIHRVRSGSWKWYRAYYRRRVHHRFVLGVRLFIITHGMRTLTPNQPSAVGAVSSAVVVHAAAWPRRLVASLHRPFPNLPRRLGRLPRRSVSLAEWPGNLPEWFGNIPQPARNLHAWFSNLPRPAGNLPERFRKPAIYLPTIDKPIPNQQLASLNPFQTSNLN